ncbi:WhiB family transcriptional regulator [Saccharopolyspora pogona]|uniref:WhiB family transcriptional regulator n=1 Tax=Saccharopolyspora pogona TaxID=333966 RepID=UPI00295B2D3F|nr:WhiB family transcriptional regulator [Saccharopolyspora pogona]
MTVPKNFEIPDFRQLGACRTEDPDLFFPVGDASRKGSQPWLQAQEAKQVCAQCPVAAQCLKWALDRGEPYGVWGGMTEQERHAAKSRNSTRKPAVVQAEVEVPAPRQHDDNQPQLELPMQEVAA